MLGLGSCGVVFILRGLDVQRLNARYSYPDQPHELVLGHTLERLHERSRDYRSGESVRVVADEIATQSAHIAQFEGYQSWGTPGYRSSTHQEPTKNPPVRRHPTRVRSQNTAKER